MTRFQNILVPFDFSPHSEAALELARELATAFDAKLHLLHAFEIPAAAATAYGVILPQGLWEQVRHSVEQRLKGLLKEVRGAEPEGEIHLVEAPPAQAIADTARAIPADLIVMGTRGLSGLKHLVLGSVAERTLRLAPCPVLTAKAEAP